MIQTGSHLLRVREVRHPAGRASGCAPRLCRTYRQRVNHPEPSSRRDSLFASNANVKNRSLRDDVAGALRLICGVRNALTGLFLIAVATSARAQQINLPPITKLTWPNGARLYLMEYRRAPMITVSAVFPGGSSVEPDGKTGVAGMTAELMRKGTTTRTAPQIAEQIDFLGGSLGASASDDRLTVGLGVLARDIDTGLDLFADIIRRPTFPGEELERARQLSLAGLDALAEDPEALAARVTTETVYAGHPYGREPTVTTVKEITRDDVAAYHQRFVTPDRMIIVAVGDFHTADIVEKLRARFGDWPRAGSAAQVVPAVTAAARRLILVNKPDATQTQVRWAGPGFKRSSPDYFAAQVAQAMLGGGFTSRLIEEVRIARSLTYSIGSAFRPQLHGGTFGVSTFTKIETTRKLIDATDAVLQAAAAQGFTADELKRMKGYLAGLFAIRVQAPEALAGELADMAFYGLPDDYLKTYLRRIQAVTLADVNRVVKTYARPKTLSLIVVGPGEKIGTQLKGLGAFQTIPVEAVGKTDDAALHGGASASTGHEGGTTVDDKTKQRIDRWIKENGRNPYGDPRDTMYAGGTPLFDERTGKTRDRYEYILEKHPELRRE